MKRALALLFMLLATAAASSGCGAPNFPNEDVLSSLRLVALIASEPEANPGDTVTITPIISDLNGNGRALVYSVNGCVDPGFSGGQDPSCAGLPSEQMIAPAGTAITSLGAANYANVAGFSAPDYTGAAATFTVTIPAAAVAFLANDGQQLPAYEQYNGASYLLDYHLASADGSATIHAVKRILVSTRPTKNTNPTITGFTTSSSNAPITALPTAMVTISPLFGAGVGSEQYQSELSDGSFVTLGESINVSWYSTDGNFTLNNTQGTASNTYWPPTPPPTTHQTVLLGIVYDGRDGEGAVMYAF